MSAILKVPGIPGGDANGEACLEIRQEGLQREADASKFTQIFDRHKVSIEYWLQLAVSNFFY